MTNKQKEIGMFCKNWRTDVLKYRYLVDFCNDYKLEYKTMWAFENGKCQNINYPMIYYRATFDADKPAFERGFFECQE